MEGNILFRSRTDAGAKLSAKLKQYFSRADVLVLALPRGGIPVGLEIANALQVPFAVFTVRKIGVPGHKELALGAVASGGIIVFNQNIRNSLSISDEEIKKLIWTEMKEVKRRERVYGCLISRGELTDKIVILADDGFATGATMKAAVKAVREAQPMKIIAAAPVGSKEICKEISLEADKVLCLATPEPFFSVGEWYEEFHQLDDDEVLDLLNGESSRCLLGGTGSK